MHVSTRTINGIDVAGLQAYVEQVKANHQEGMVKFAVSTDWQGGTKSAATVSGWEMGGKPLAKHFVIEADEPFELLGKNEAPNPQELLLAAMNACMTVGYVATAASMGVKLTALNIRTSGVLDLRGFLGLDEAVKPGYDEISYVVEIKGDGTREQMQRIHETVIRTSPNRWNIANAIRLNSELRIG